MDPNDTDVFCKGIHDRYADRPHSPDIFPDMCLADFASKYNIKVKPYENDEENREHEAHVVEDDQPQPPGAPTRRRKLQSYTLLDGETVISERRVPKVIRYVHYNEAQDPVNYYREMVLLFYPWRDENLEVETANCEAIYKNKRNKRVILANYNRYNAVRVDLNAIAHALENDRLEGENEQIRLMAGEGQPIHSQPEFLNHYDYDDTIIRPNILVEMGEAVEECVNVVKKYVVPGQMKNDEYYALVDSLNIKQRDYLMHVISLFEQGELPFYHFISGGAGVGKSRLISAIYQSVLRIIRREPGPVDDDMPEILVAAPTGKAAHNIGGMTVHHTFHLKVNQGQNTVDGGLNFDTLNTLRAKFSKVRLIIIDEVSMLSLGLFHQIHENLRQIYRIEASDLQTIFGGIPVIVVGDFNQLRPVKGSFVFEDFKTGPQSIVGNLLWPRFQLYELTEIMRQRDDKLFAEALGRLAAGTLTADDIRLFNGRCYNEDELPEAGKQCIHLFSWNADVQSYNTKQINLKRNNVPEPLEFVHLAFDRVLGTVTPQIMRRVKYTLNDIRAQEAGGLPGEIVLMVGLRYMITANIDVGDGLFNGASGVLRFIEIVSQKAEAVYIEFDDPKVGAAARSKRAAIYEANRGVLSETWTPILRYKKTFNILERGSVTVSIYYYLNNSVVLLIDVCFLI